jgi:hypothetical protein
LLSALLLQVFYGIRSERQLMEQLDYNLLYRWFSGAHSGVGELRFDRNKVEYRPLVFFGPGAAEVTILIGCFKKGRVYNPRNAFDTALERRKDAIANPRRMNVWDV